MTSLRDLLERHAMSICDARATTELAAWLREHGPALLAALEDAARWRKLAGAGPMAAIMVKLLDDPNTIMGEGTMTYAELAAIDAARAATSTEGDHDN